MPSFAPLSTRFKKIFAASLFFTLGAGLILVPVTARAEASKNNFFYVLEAEGLGGYSDIPGHHGTVSSIDSWLVSPTWKLNDKLYWINLYNGSFDRSAQVVAQEEGGRRADTTQSHNLSSSLKYNVTDTWSLRPLFFAEWNFVNETADEKFGKGLYDYHDIGGGIESSWITQETREQKDENRLGFRYLNREYPNYHSLLSLFDRNSSVEDNEKDLNGYKFNLSHDSRSKEGWSWGLEGIFFYKDYTDKKTIDLNGIRSGGARQDYVEYVNAHIAHPLSKEWMFRLDGQFTDNQSNLDFYDTHNTSTFADDNFLKNYFDYFSFMAKPSLIYTKNIEKDRDFVLTVSYTFDALHYPGRKAQDVSGVYQAADEQDYTHTVTAKTNYPLTKYVSWVVYGSYANATSNQKFESFYLYTYESWTAVTGISFKY